MSAVARSPQMLVRTHSGQLGECTKPVKGTGGLSLMRSRTNKLKSADYVKKTYC